MPKTGSSKFDLGIGDVPNAYGYVDGTFGKARPGQERFAEIFAIKI